MDLQIKTSDNGIRLIKRFEGLELKAYFDAVGVPTIGYGHTRTVTAKDVKQGKTITENEATILLIDDLKDAEKAVNDLVKVELNQNQFDALVSFTYNLGKGNFAKSTLLRLLNNKQYLSAASEFAKWNRAGGKILQGLVNRRKAEENLFLA